MKRILFIALLLTGWALCAPAQQLISNQSKPYTSEKGLDGRHIALWGSHGIYYKPEADRWQWERARLFETVEDLYTSSYTMPYLVPMLENAGAVVLQPRERDIQTNEIVVKQSIRLTTDSTRTDEKSLRANVDKTGDYAVYIRYDEGKKNVRDAHLELKVDGRITEFVVNETMLSNSWLYLGHHHFNAGQTAVVTLTNQSATAEGEVNLSGLRLGGGMGSIKRGGQVSGYPRFCEAARYYLEYDGYPRSVWYYKDDLTEYRADNYSRPVWVNYLLQQKNVPVDLAFAFHTDAGVTSNDSTIGTLMIYSSEDQNDNRYADRSLRSVEGKNFGMAIQDQIVNDMRALYEPRWTRRKVMDRSYIETRIPEVPALILELLSHQNLADMRYGMDPRVQFSMSRSIYKGMLRYLAQKNHTDYVVQPLPVLAMATRLDGEEISVTWEAQQDPLEATATPSYYIVYTREGDGDWDNGVRVNGTEYRMHATADVAYSFMVRAGNEGGVSMPSQIMGACRASNAKGEVLIIDGFDRICAPLAFDHKEEAGFIPSEWGIADNYAIHLIGAQYDMERRSEWKDDDAPGWGASHANYERMVTVGNTHDYSHRHGALWLNQGYSYSSTSTKALSDTMALGYQVVDLVLGEQKTTILGNTKKVVDFACYPKTVQKALSNYTARKDGLVLVSGSHVGTDIKDDAALTKWAEQTLHFTWRTNHGSFDGKVIRAKGKTPICQFETEPNDKVCQAASVDAIEPCDGGETLFRYDENNKSAATRYKNGNLRVIVLGFPLDAVSNKEEQKEIIKEILK